MCGRFALSDTQQLSLRFEVAPGDERSLIPRYNVAPTQIIPVIVEAPSGRALHMMRWGFKPSWKNESRSAPDPINARAETLLERPMFRPALAKRRCLIPANGFYEWQAESGAKTKQPYFIRLREAPLFAFAGLYTVGRDDQGDSLESCAIITTEANNLMAPIHNRMPAILELEAESAWLDPELDEPEAVMPLLRPYRAGEMVAYAVSTRVSSARNDGPDLIEPLKPA
jgi:putative SOS response-associated peptidase YedK